MCPFRKLDFVFEGQGGGGGGSVGTANVVGQLWPARLNSSFTSEKSVKDTNYQITFA